MSRKPFNIGDKVYRPTGSQVPVTIVGKNLQGRWLYQCTNDITIYSIADPSLWDHYVEPVTSYVNIFSSGEAMIYMNKKHADADPEGCEGSRIACVKITYKEGQFDD